MMTTLAELQDRFQRAILADDDGILAEIVDSPRERRDVLFSVYRNAYVLRLVEVLAHDYEQLAAYLGETPFGQAARTFIRHNPSRTTNARWYGSPFPDFLRTHPPYCEQPILGDLAALERALNDVFDAADASPLGLADLARVAPDDFAGLVFTPHPATRRLDLTTNAVDLWRALKEGTDRPAPHRLAEPDRVIAFRTDGQARFRVMTSAEAMMWDEAAKGVRFSVLCEMLAVHGGEEDAAATAASYLKGWIEAGMLASAASPALSAR